MKPKTIAIKTARWASPTSANNNGRFPNEAAAIKQLNKRKDFAKAIDIGRILWRIKPLFATNPEWLGWLKGNLPFAQSIANRYMRCFEQRDKLLATLPANAPVIAAYRLAGIATGHESKPQPNQAVENKQ